jgi:hypothetical protein
VQYRKLTFEAFATRRILVQESLALDDLKLEGEDLNQGHLPGRYRICMYVVLCNLRSIHPYWFRFQMYDIGVIYR